MNRIIVYLSWAFAILMGVVIVVLFLMWVAPIFYILSRPFVKIFKKFKKD